MSTYARLAILALVLAALAAGWWKLETALDAREAKGYARHQQEAKDLADQQAQRNRDLQRAAELRYTVQAETRDRFITTTITEVRHATAHLDACPVGAAGVLRLNAAAQCAREDRPASCGADEPVRRAD